MGNDQIVEVEDCGWVHGNAQLPLDRSLRDENDKKPVSIRGVDRGIHYSFFGGRIVLGPDYKAVFASIFLIVAPLVVFYALVIPYTITHMSWAYLFVSVLLTVFVLTMLISTATRDPGFYPRSPAQTTLDMSMTSQPMDHHLENGYTVATKFCRTCYHYRPPRCSHCAVCDNCVDKFDHHCPWVGNCIGRRNYRTFFLFISSTTILCFWVIIISILQLNDSAKTQHDGNWGPAIAAYPASIVVSVYAFLASWFVGGLTGFHIILISSNTTTYEHFRRRYSGAGNPYDQGIWGNWKEALLTSTPARFKPLWEKQKASLGWAHDSSDDDTGAHAMEEGQSLSAVSMAGSLPPSVGEDRSSPDAPNVPITIQVQGSMMEEDQAHVV